MKEIKNYPDYKIDADGNVYSFRGKKNGYKLKGIHSSQSRRYLQVGLYSPFGNRPEFKYIHRLVWETFKGEIPKDMQVDHIDGNPANNKLTNLRLLTHKDNVKIWNLTSRKNGDLRLKRDEIIKMHESGMTYSKIARHFGCVTETIGRIIRNTVHGPTATKNITKYEKFDSEELNKIYEKGTL